MEGDRKPPKDVLNLSNLPGEALRSISKGGPYEWMNQEFRRLMSNLDGKPHRPVVIAVLASGIDTRHPSLKGIVDRSRNFATTFPDQVYPSFGTSLAHIIAQHAGQHVKIIDIKVEGDHGVGLRSDVIRALEWIYETPNLQVDIILFGFGTPQLDDRMDKIISKLGEEKIIIAPVGNAGHQPGVVSSLTCNNSVISVGACDIYGNRANFSAVAEELDFLFPGKDVDLLRSGYDSREGNIAEKCSGTSFAASHCAALAALILALVETQLSPSGSHWREILADSSNMRQFLMRFGTKHTADRGYGVPDLRNLTEENIKTHVMAAFDVTESELYSASQKETRVPGIPEEFYRLSREYRKAYEEACAYGTQTVHQCRVMLIGHEGAGKTNIKNTLLDRDFQEDHIITNGMEVEINKTRQWRPYSVEDEFKDMVADYMIDNVTLQHKMEDEKKGVRDATPAVQDHAEGGGKTPNRSQHEGNGKSEQTPLNRPNKPREEQRPSSKWRRKFDVLTHAKVKTDIPDDIKMITGKKLSMRAAGNEKTDKSELFFWDSGGQYVFYNTTKTFLTRRCVYIIAMDMTKDLDFEIQSTRKNHMGCDVPDMGCLKTVRAHLEYWFSCIHTFLSEAKYQGDPAALPPVDVIIVCTHKDACPADYSTQYCKRIEEFLKDKPYRHHCQGIYTLSNSQRDGTDVSELRQKILELATAHAYEVPLTWFNFKEKLLKSDMREVPMKNWAEVTALGHQLGMTQVAVEGALTFFHEVGDIIFFNEPSLKDFIITDPRWLIQQIHKVITVPTYHQPGSMGEQDNHEELPNDFFNHCKTLDEQGILHEELLNYAWPESIRKQLVFLMMKFALLLPMCSGTVDAPVDRNRETRYLVPCLLPSVEPDAFMGGEKGTTAPPLLLEPPEGFMPVGLTSRLFAGLANEDGWNFAVLENEDGKKEEQVFINAAKFLPKDTGTQITILQQPEFIEVYGEEVSDDEETAEFAVPLKNILYRLDAITSTVCPTQGFKIKIHCLECIEWGKKYQVDLAEAGKRFWPDAMAGESKKNPAFRIDNLKDFMTCMHEEHQQKCPIWFRQEGSIRGDPRDLITMADSMRTELEHELPRLLGSTGPGALISEMFIAYIRSLKILGNIEIGEMEAAVTRAKKVDVLIKSLLPCSRRNLVLFAWVLVKLNQGHQLPESIGKEERVMLHSYNREEMVQQAEEVHDVREGLGDAWSRHRSQVLNHLEDWLDLQDGLIGSGPWHRQDVERELRLEPEAKTIVGHLTMVTNIYLQDGVQLQPPPRGLIQLLQPPLPRPLQTERYIIKFTKVNVKRVDERQRRVEAKLQATFFLTPVI